MSTPLGFPGANVLDSQAVTTEYPIPSVSVGSRFVGANNEIWIFVKANTALTAGYVAQIDRSFNADHVTTANSKFNFPLGIPAISISAGAWGWVQTNGPARVGVRGAASAAADVRLNTTATAGQIDDDGSAGAKVVEGISFTTAVGGAAAVQAAILNNPTVGATL